MKFDGFLTLYQEGGRPEPPDAGSRGRREPPPAADAGRRPARARAASPPTQHFTEPPPRYTEASLVKRMEELGIGRPSTYAAVLQVLRDREYVRIEKKRLVPEDKGRIVTAFLESFFRRYVEYDFTADLEEQLDRVSNHEIDWKEVLRDFWRDFSAAIGETKELRTTAGAGRAQRAARPHIFPAEGRRLEPARLPDLRHRPALAEAQQVRRVHRLLELSGMPLHPPARRARRRRRRRRTARTARAGRRKALGEDPETGQPVTLRDGRFGPFVQLGEGEKPKRASLPKGWPPAAVDLEKALRLLRLPARGGDASRGRPADPGRHRPLRPVRAARQDLRQSRPRRRRVRDRRATAPST